MVQWGNFLVTVDASSNAVVPFPTTMPNNADGDACRCASIWRWENGARAPATVALPTKAASQLAQAYLANGALADVTAAGQPQVIVHCSGLPQTRGDLAGFFAWGSANPTLTRVWVDETMTAFTLTGAEFVVLPQKAGDWVDKVYEALAIVVSRINSGKITTRAQLDAMNAAQPID